MFKLVQPAPKHGTVTIVGAGPGDADLLTIKALRCIQSADIILYDRLVSQDIRDLFPTETPAFYVGKAAGNHCIPQAQLNQLLIEKAQKGYSICRLKGGDPFVFGRGGEEMLALHQAGIQVEVVPGVTAGVGAAAYSGIPVTHRGLAQACTFITGHGEKSLDVDWSSLAKMQHTLVFYMGLGNLADITKQLTHHGMCADMPAALIENGCRKDQRTFTGQLSNLEQIAKQHQLRSPTLIVIGRVVELAESLHWFASLTSTNAQIAQMTA
ncbi:uroporphyrinogen-III C-methyltransferase [Gayadomonas joobiniege]|uniref:uroporphyrinogen-III C-methyltransferase n=1 Tax=Gayadomonas joobiniege TaxID=1234606 RepID=UPI00035DF9EC|nr:uroporphyrinogen-III C-methyltransferase [Gayadomonas joobiniege]